ncbi:hypothetical protein [Spongiactinospora gelatinilytica]|nr:hypothetical protein [Spongiactinospora gelatinilytica]
MAEGVGDRPAAISGSTSASRGVSPSYIAALVAAARRTTLRRDIT